MTKKNSKETARTRVSFHMRTLIRTSLHGFEVKADRTTLHLTDDGLIMANRPESCN